jgi:glycosyltransferase involved in cell wall biosynthesis
MSVVHALAATGEFECWLGVNPGFASRRVPPLPVVRLPGITGEVIGVGTFWRARTVARKVRAWLEEDQARIFHANSRAGLVVALWLARGGEPRVVASVHCYGRRRWFYRWAARRLEGRLFWLSPAMKRFYGAGNASWDQCIPGCVARRDDAPDRPSARVGGTLRLGGIGALVGWKGWHLVPEAIAALPAAVRGRIRFRHIGGPDESAASRRYAASLPALTAARGLAGRVEWCGPQPSSEGLLREIDVLVVASRHEPFSVALLEALAAGVPVLAADSGGAGDVLTPGRNGWFFRTGDAADLGRAIAALLEDGAWAGAGVTPEDVRPFLAPAVAAQWRRVYGALGRR